MRKNEKRKTLKALADLSTALREATAIAESAVAAATATQELLKASVSTADQWRKLAEGAQNRPVVVESVLVPYCKWVN